jgi:thiol-disulfide isomerase/thioredoxin/DNA-binding beta-propeller fold protein YncE
MSHDRSWRRWTRAAIAVFLVAAFLYTLVGLDLIRGHRPIRPESGLGAESHLKPISYNQGSRPSLSGGVAWINSGPITLAELRGKIVLLDFWTFCCINCQHVLPDLAKLEEKYRNELVVIGVHTAKFEAERDTQNIRRKVAEYRIKHPVVNDANQVIWRRFGVNSWPTLVVIDANGRFIGMIGGEGHYAQLDQVIGQLVERHKANGELNLTPLKFSPEMERPVNGPLLYPGKVLADEKGKRLFISDTGHNRIVQTDLEGSNPVVIGSGEEGFDDGSYEKARFNRPQGMCLADETLYVADTENHAIRAVDLKAGTVTTVAGIGSQSPRMQAIPFSGPAKETALSSPWDVIQLPGERALYIAMAGPHQIWKLDLDALTVGVYAGSGYENILDGPPDSARFAQPSGLATDGENLFVADSEDSGVRMITGIRVREPLVRTVVGRGLFEFGDRDGRGPYVRLQHCLGLSYGDGRLYIADTYNNKVKVSTPRTQAVKTLVGSHEPGDSENPPRFYQPGGLSVAGTNLYLADTNNHKIRVIDLKTNAVKTLALAGLTPPRTVPRAPTFPNAKVIKVPAVEVEPGDSLRLAVSIPLPKDYKLNAEFPMPYLVETPGKTGILAAEATQSGRKIKPPASQFQVTVPLAKAAAAGDSWNLRFSTSVFVCSETSNLCMIRSFIWDVPISFGSRGGSAAIRLSSETK